MSVSTQAVRFSPFRLAPAAPSVKWIAPAPLWGGASGMSSTPWLAEFQDDSFVQDFIGLMGSQSPGNLQQYVPADSNPDGSWKFYQPLHKRYYLVTGSLVCRQYSLPDHAVSRKSGDKTSFVLRRMINDPVYGWIECGWMKNVDGTGSWQQVTDKFGNYNQLSVPATEDRQPLHPVKANISAIPIASTQAAVGQPGPEQRTIYYGYIPVASREKYLTPAQPADIQQAIQDNGGSAQLELEDVQARVIDAWRRLATSPGGSQLQPGQIGLYLILDLGDFLKNNLPDVFNALGTNGNNLNNKPNQKALFDELGKVFMPTSSAASGEITLAGALYNLRDDLSLVYGQGQEPTDTYQMDQVYTKDSAGNHQPISLSDYLKVPPPTAGTLYSLFSNALNEAGTPVQVPSEVADMIKVEPASGDVYFIRLVYERNGCPPVVSDPSASFIFAKIIDPDAPARHIRIEMPSVKMQDLRKFKRGVGIQSSPELARVMNNLSDPKGILNGSGINLDVPGVGMICSFSIQIIFIIAFILMFIFLILLNIVFWWIAFFKICFPVPKGK